MPSSPRKPTPAPEIPWSSGTESSTSTSPSEPGAKTSSLENGSIPSALFAPGQPDSHPPADHHPRRPPSHRRCARLAYNLWAMNLEQKLEELKKRDHLAEEGGGTRRREKQHKEGKMSARER